MLSDGEPPSSTNVPIELGVNTEKFTEAQGELGGEGNTNKFLRKSTRRTPKKCCHELKKAHQPVRLTKDPVAATVVLCWTKIGSLGIR